MVRCRFIKDDGTRCKASAVKSRPNGMCLFHYHDKHLAKVKRARRKKTDPDAAARARWDRKGW